MPLKGADHFPNLSGKGFLLTLEGPEGSGKSSLIQYLDSHLKSAGYPLLLTREPGGTALGSQIREWLLHKQDLAPWTELLLFLADRTQHLHEIIFPALQQGQLVLCDRFMDSTTAYQHAGRGFDLNLIQAMHAHTLQNFKPHLTLLLDVEVSVGLERARQATGKQHDKFEALDITFHERVRQAFLTLAQQEPQRFVVVDTTHAAAEDVGRQVLAQVLSRLKAHFVG